MLTSVLRFCRMSAQGIGTLWSFCHKDLLSTENATHAGPVLELCTWNWCHALGPPSVLVLFLRVWWPIMEHMCPIHAKLRILSAAVFHQSGCRQLYAIIRYHTTNSYNFVLSFWTRWAVTPTFCCSWQTYLQSCYCIRSQKKFNSTSALRHLLYK